METLDLGKETVFGLELTIINGVLTMSTKY